MTDDRATTDAPAAATKRRELEAFRNTVTDWEREQYVETL